MFFMIWNQFSSWTSIQKASQNMLEAILNRISRNSKNAPSYSFCLFFYFSKRGTKTLTIQKTIPRCVQKTIAFFDRYGHGFKLIFMTTGAPNLSKSPPKPQAKSKQKHNLKMKHEILILAFEMN